MKMRGENARIQVCNKSPYSRKNMKSRNNIQQMPIFRFLCGKAYKKNRNEYSLVFHTRKQENPLSRFAYKENTRNIQEIRAIIPTAELKQRGSESGFFFIYTQQLRSQTFVVDFIYVLLNVFLCGARHTTYINPYRSTYKVQQVRREKLFLIKAKKNFGFRAKMQYRQKIKKYGI